MINKGDKFGRLTVIRDSGERRRRAVIFECVCECGAFKKVIGHKLTSGNTRSCGCLRGEVRKLKRNGKPHIKKATINKIGIKINKLTLTNLCKNERSQLRAILKCECGSIVDRDYKEFIKGRIKSCGCIKKNISIIANEKKKLRLIEKQSKKQHIEFKPHKNETGKVYGNLSVLYFCGVNIDKKGHKHSLWYCQCKCGLYTIKKASSFKINEISCGCIVKNKRKFIKRKPKRDNPYFKGDTSRKQLDRKNRRKKKLIKDRVIAKFYGVCAFCSSCNNLHLHHIKEHALFPHLRYLPANHVLLCKKCHEELHAYFDYKPIPFYKHIIYIANNYLKHKDKGEVTRIY